MLRLNTIIQADPRVLRLNMVIQADQPGAQNERGEFTGSGTRAMPRRQLNREAADGTQPCLVMGPGPQAQVTSHGALGLLQD